MRGGGRGRSRLGAAYIGLDVRRNNIRDYRRSIHGPSICAGAVLSDPSNGKNGKTRTGRERKNDRGIERETCESRGVLD